ncbi:MAG: acetyl/propionyl/methylcrotonyl-CoA carboxylase subunit alpha [Alphaproteobacteria bacterium GM202ARS2]|nr:acetyl/propionyl/methylcrotonyl-CoA carboxylase subunit alpha [Alphaproteobacteria bacterium GM202ARS2]
MFKKILIAHRGEIACRVMRTAKRMGIKTVAVHSDVDADAPHVRMADEAFAIGGSLPKDSYLRGDVIIDVMKRSGAQGVHPGYGFLSENADFARAVHKAGLVFIGPPPEAIAAMGDKIRSKQLAKKAGVNTIPGYDGVVKDYNHALSIAKDIGYPVMVKASAGGGGKGMRLVHKQEDLKDSMTRAKNEARNSFGDDRIFIEKFITNPRHIEIQLLADQHGNAIYVGERECSIQRRHQKVIEEAPSPFVDAAMRKNMGEQAVALARAVNYASAGTVEFVVGDDKKFYFLEMNTRLQVEHPVSELTTGIDLVEEMLRIASGEKLRIQQNAITIKGSAIECRIYAEDSKRGFLPSIGRLSRYQQPDVYATDDHAVRIDSGIEAGSTISMFYDPMIAKLCSYAPNRGEAIDKMRLALNQYTIEGVAHNIDFLSRILRDPIFTQGQATTHYIDDNFAEGYSPPPPDKAHEGAFIAAVAFLRYQVARLETSIEGQMPGHHRNTPKNWIVLSEKKKTKVTIKEDNDTLAIYRHDNKQTYRLSGTWSPIDHRLRCVVNDQEHAFHVVRLNDNQFVVHASGFALYAHVVSPDTAELYDYMPIKQQEDLSNFLLAPMPGLLVSLSVKEGDKVHAGQALAVIEAMKMENVLHASKDAIIDVIEAKVGDSLDVDQSILRFKDDSKK